MTETWLQQISIAFRGAVRRDIYAQSPDLLTSLGRCQMDTNNLPKEKKVQRSHMSTSATLLIYANFFWLYQLDGGQVVPSR